MPFCKYPLDYLSTDIMESPVQYSTMRTQVDYISTLMKTAKNRSRIVKILRDMQEK